MGRLRQTGLSLGLSVLSLVGMLLVICTVVSGALSLLFVGAFLFTGFAALQRSFTDFHLSAASRVLDRNLSRAPRRALSGGVISRFRQTVTDSGTWRDISWLVVNSVTGLTLTLISPVLLVHGVAALLLPVFYDRLELGPRGFPYMNQFYIDAHNALPVGLTLAAVSLVLWFLLTPPLTRANAHLAKALLTGDEATSISRASALSAP